MDQNSLLNEYIKKAILDLECPECYYKTLKIVKHNSSKKFNMYATCCNCKLETNLNLEPKRISINEFNEAFPSKLVRKGITLQIDQNLISKNRLIAESLHRSQNGISEIQWSY